MFFSGFSRRSLPAAKGYEPADLVLRGGMVANVFTGELELKDVAVHGGMIVGVGHGFEGVVEEDCSGLILAPSYIDSHLHVESTYLTPPGLARLIAPFGVGALIADPHEIGNVLGLAGVKFMLESSEGLEVDFFFMAPSCVPATDMETSGASMPAEDLAHLLRHPRVLGLGEVMNMPGVLNGDEALWAKLSVYAQRPRDGHSPGLTGKELGAYLGSGIHTDHECSTAEEAMERMSMGAKVLIREGSQAKNLEALLPAVNGRTLRMACLCTDDRHLNDLVAEGHINHVLNLAVKYGESPMRALIMATLNAAETFGLGDRGAIAPGRRADIVVLPSWEREEANFTPLSVYKNGRKIAERGELVPHLRERPMPVQANLPSSMNVGTRLDLGSFVVPLRKSHCRIIGLKANELLTTEIIESTPQTEGRLCADPARDLARLSVIERHCGSGYIAHGLVRGFGLAEGAIATSVAHDSHNIIVLGISEEDMLVCTLKIREMGGGLCVARGGKVLAAMPLEVGGLMSSARPEDAVSRLEEVHNALRSLNFAIAEPFGMLSFLALPVIPDLKLTDRGLFDVTSFSHVPLFVD